MRTSGVLTDIAALHRGDHVCWPFTDRDHFRSVACAFIEAGVALGEQVVYFGWSGLEQAHRDIEHVTGLARMLERGAVRVAATEASDAGGYLLDAETVADQIEIDVDLATRSGFTGLRLFADATAVLRSPADRRAFFDLDMRLDRSMAEGLALTAMCAFDSTKVDHRTAAEFECTHPASHAELSEFTLHATRFGGFAVQGEVDLVCRERFERVLEREHIGSDVVRIAAAHLTYIDHRSLMALDRWSAARGVTAVLEDCGETVRRLVEVMPLDHVIVRPGR